MNELKLKPCPFCGGNDARVYSVYSGLSNYVFCPDCNGHSGDYECLDDAIKAWNRRTPNLPKLDKLTIADEVYKWWMCYMENPKKIKEPKMPFGIWLLHVIDKVRKELSNEDT